MIDLACAYPPPVLSYLLLEPGEELPPVRDANVGDYLQPDHAMGFSDVYRTLSQAIVPEQFREAVPQYRRKPGLRGVGCRLKLRSNISANVQCGKYGFGGRQLGCQ
jgi:hypothetical protein